MVSYMVNSNGNNMKIKITKNLHIIAGRKDLDKVVLAEKYLCNSFHISTGEKIKKELQKTPLRYDVINFLLSKLNRETHYLEIGVRYPEQNFDKILATHKYSVDPGVENEKNPVDYKLTSDEFFEQLRQGKILNSQIKFDAIFIDGLHLADQVERDINNALEYLKEDGFIIMHDCNPPTEFHASENYAYRLSPSEDYWNGTTWKAFFKARKREDIYSCCIDTDWGVGVISKSLNLGAPTKVQNPFYEFFVFNENRTESLNLVSFDQFKAMI